MRLVSYNIGLVNMEAEHLDVNALLNDLSVLRADVLALHEFDRRLRQDLDDALLAKYPYNYHLVREDMGYSCALFSRYELKDIEELWIYDSDKKTVAEGQPERDSDFLIEAAITKEERRHASKRGVIGATVLLPDGRSTRIITCHLMSNGFNYLMFETMLSPFLTFRAFWKRYLLSCEARAVESQYIREWVNKAHAQGLPIMVFGDTNSFWWTECIQIIRSGGSPYLYDAFESVVYPYRFGKIRAFLRKIASIFGYGHTLYAHKVMFFRLDYLFHCKNVQILSYKTQHWRYSDHYPLIVDVDLLKM